MNRRVGFYKLLLKLYPPRHREAFGEQMLQTFVDQLEDLELSGHPVGVSFWLSTVADEITNILNQYALSLLAGSGFLKPTVSKFFISAMLGLPLFAAFCALTVKVSLALPHPHTSGIFAIVAIAAVWLLLPGTISLLASYVLASAMLSAWQKLKARIA